MGGTPSKSQNFYCATSESKSINVFPECSSWMTLDEVEKLRENKVDGFHDKLFGSMLGHTSCRYIDKIETTIESEMSIKSTDNSEIGKKITFNFYIKNTALIGDVTDDTTDSRNIYCYGYFDIQTRSLVENETALHKAYSRHWEQEAKRLKREVENPSEDELDNSPEFINLRSRNLIIHRANWTIENNDTALGIGSFGSVFKGKFTDSANNREYNVAIKKIQISDDSISQENQKMLLNELSIIKNNNSQGMDGPLLHAYGISKHKNKRSGAKSLSLIMERGNFSLKTKLDNLNQLSNGLSISDQLSIALNIAKGIEVLHRAGIVHKDIKDSNVIMIENGSSIKAKLSDYGLAEMRNQRRTGSTSSIASIREREGTRVWQAPEVVIGSRHTKSSDIFSFGLILWRLIKKGESLFVNVDLTQGGLQHVATIGKLPSDDANIRQLYTMRFDYKPLFNENDQSHPLFEIANRCLASTHTLIVNGLNHTVTPSNTNQRPEILEIISTLEARLQNINSNGGNSNMAPPAQRAMRSTPS